MNTPERSTAAAFPRYSNGEVLADSATLQWPGLYMRRSRFPRVVARFLVPATPEPLISCQLQGSAEFQEREVGDAWENRISQKEKQKITFPSIIILALDLINPAI